MHKIMKRLTSLLLVLSLIIVISPAYVCAEEKGEDSIKNININTASLNELTQLKRVGPKYAQRIIDFREKHGSFQKPEDIVKVKGIGPKTFEANKDIIIVK